MTDIETALRDALARTGTNVSPAADRVIATYKAGANRRRRFSAGGAAAVVVGVVALTVSGAWLKPAHRADGAVGSPGQQAVRFSVFERTALSQDRLPERAVKTLRRVFVSESRFLGSFDQKRYYVVRDTSAAPRICLVRDDEAAAAVESSCEAEAILAANALPFVVTTRGSSSLEAILVPDGYSNVVISGRRASVAPNVAWGALSGSPGYTVTTPSGTVTSSRHVELGAVPSIAPSMSGTAARPSA